MVEERLFDWERDFDLSIVIVVLWLRDICRSLLSAIYFVEILDT